MKKIFFKIVTVIVLIFTLSYSLFSCSDSDVPNEANYVVFHYGTKYSREGYLIQAEKIEDTQFYAIDCFEIKSFSDTVEEPIREIVIMHESKLAFYTGEKRDFPDVKASSTKKICEYFGVKVENGFLVYKENGAITYTKSPEFAFSESDIDFVTPES